MKIFTVKNKSSELIDLEGNKLDGNKLFSSNFRFIPGKFTEEEIENSELPNNILEIGLKAAKKWGRHKPGVAMNLAENLYKETERIVKDSGYDI